MNVYLITLTDKNKENLDTWNSYYNEFFKQELIKNSKVNNFIISNYIKDNSIDQERLSRFLLNHEYTKIIENSEIQNIIQNALKLTYRKLKFNVADCFNSYKTILNKNQTQFCDRV